MSAIVQELESPFGDEDVSLPADVAAALSDSDQPQTADTQTDQPDDTQAQTDTQTDQKPEQTEEPKPENVETEDQKTTDWRGEATRAKAELAARDEKIVELEARLTEKEEESVSIKVDGPVANWTGRQQMDAMPNSYRDDLLMHAFTGRSDPADPQSPNNLEVFVHGVLENPEEYEDELTTLRAATGVLMERSLKRPFQEIAEILSTVEGYKPADIKALVEQRTFRASEDQQTVTRPVDLHGENARLYQLAQEAGIDIEDPAQRAFLARLDGAYRGMAGDISELRSRLGEFENSTKSREERAAQSLQVEMHELVGQQVEQLKAQVIADEIKGKMSEEDKAALLPFIAAAVDISLARNNKANEILGTAKDLSVDLADGTRKLHSKVSGHLRSYGVHVTTATKKAVADLLRRTVVPSTAQTRAVDAAKTNRTVVGAASTQVSNRTNPELTALDDERVKSLDEAINWTIRRDAARPRV